MNDEINYKNNPLHGVGLKTLLSEMVEHYGFKILYAYLNINCFKVNPSIDSSVKFLKKTDWAREKVESFYLYEFKRLPRASAEQFELPPRDRIVPEGQVPGDPAELSLEDAVKLSEKRSKKSAAHRDAKSGNYSKGGRFSKKQESAKKHDRELSNTLSPAQKSDIDPWANWKK